MKRLLAALGVVILLAGCDFKKDDAGTTADTTTTPVLTAENCSNGNDDDGDGAIDCADPDCANSTACKTTTTTTTTGTASFAFEGVTATRDANKFYLRGYVRNKGKARGTVGVGLKAKVEDLALISSDTATVEVPTLDPGLRSAFSYETEVGAYPTITWIYWLKYSGSTKKEYTISYIPPPLP